MVPTFKILDALSPQKSRRWWTSRFWPAASFIVLVASCTPSESIISVDPQTRLQTMTGWEVTPRGWEQDKKNDRYDPSFVAGLPVTLERLVNDLGINRIRLEVWSGAENPVDYVSRFLRGEIGYQEMKHHRYEKINDNADPATIDPAGFQFAHLDWQIENIALPMKALLEARKDRLYLNFCYVDFKFASDQGRFSHAENPDEYAEIIAASFRHLRDKYGITPDGFEIILEPENTEDWSKKRGAAIGPCLVAAVDRLKAEGFAPDVIAPSCKSTGAALDYFDKLIRFPGVRERLDTFSYHRYGGDSPANLEAVGKRGAQFHLRTGMAERLGADVDKLYQDLTLANVSFWQQWGIAEKHADRGYFYLVGSDTGDPAKPNIRLSSRSRLLQQYFRHVRIGDVRIGATSNNPAECAPVAFVDPEGNHTVVVRLRSERAFSVEGLPAGRYEITFSGQAHNHARLDEQVLAAGETLRLAGPEAGVMTISARPGG